jgi:hypothetical protein
VDEERAAEIAGRQGGVVSVAQLRACGLSASGSRHRTNAHRLFRVRRGVYALGPVVHPRAALWAAVLATSAPDASISHWTAARVHGIAGRSGAPIHVTVPGSGGRSLADVHVHRARTLAAEDTMLVDGLRVTTPARTVLDIAARAADHEVLRLIREGEYLGLLPAGAMLDAVASHPRHPGAPRVRRVDPATATAALQQTPLEDDLAALIATLPVPTPRSQLSVRGASGAGYRLDFGWPDARVAAEADGRSAHERSASLESDRFRDNDLAAVGWQTLRFTRLQIVRGRFDTAKQIVSTVVRRGLDVA